MTEDTNKKGMELSVVSMHKGIHQAGERYGDISGDWLILGHFDSLSIAPLGAISQPEQHILEYVWKDLSSHGAGNSRTQLGTYRNALYLLPAISKKDIPQNGSYPFMFVTRIRENSSYEHIASKQALHSTVEAALGGDISFACYPTLGLSDLVLVMWSDSLATLLDKVERLFACPYIGDTYTFCCIAKAAMSSSKGIWDEDVIPYISIRLTVRSTAVAFEKIQQWRKLQQKGRNGVLKGPAVKESYFVTGSADVNVLLQDISSYSFVQFLKDILDENKEPVSEASDDIAAKEKSIWDAFDDMTTQMGKSFGDKNVLKCQKGVCQLLCADPPDSLQLRNALYEAFELEAEKLRRVVEGRHESWVNPIFELMNSLIYLSKNRVLDQLCYVLLSSVQGFVVKLQELDEKFKYVKDLYTFVDKLSFVKEHIIRMESQLGQHPGARPVLFSLPVNTIESYLTFIDLCAGFLQIKDTEETKKRFYFLIVPCLCETVSVQSLLYSQNESNHLLYIQIPLEQCYAPNEVGQALAHEIGHYSGEMARNRELRFDALLYCCATLLSEKLGFGLEQTCIDRIMKELSCNIESKDQKFMKNIEPALEKSCKSLIHDEKFIYSLRDDMIRSLELPDRYRRMEELNEDYREMWNEDGIEYVIDIMKEVEMLSQECYADIAMFSLLPITASDYIRLIWKRKDSGLEEPKANIEDKENTKNMSRALLVERISLVLSIVGASDVGRPKVDLDATTWEDDQINQLASDVADYCQMLCALAQKPLPAIEQERLFTNIQKKQNFEGRVSYHPIEIIYTIHIYLVECWNSMPKYGDYVEGERISRLYRAMISVTGAGEPEQEAAIRNYRHEVEKSSIGCNENATASIKKILNQRREGLCTEREALDALVYSLGLSREDAQTVVALMQ